MNTLMLVALAVVALCYCGSKYCPKVLSSNKELVLGVIVGMALCSFAGLRLEGYGHDGRDLDAGSGSMFMGGYYTRTHPNISRITIPGEVH